MSIHFYNFLPIGTLTLDKKITSREILLVIYILTFLIVKLLNYLIGSLLGVPAFLGYLLGVFSFFSITIIVLSISV